MPTSGRSASARTRSGSESHFSSASFSLPSRSLPPPANRYGALAAEWSRSASISSFGDSGLSVFHAGHWSWQRPHSVQVEKSSRPFHVKSSTAPTPNLASSAGSSKSIGTPPEAIGLSAPSAVPPSAFFLNQMLGNARKRCQATLIVEFRPMVMAQTIEMTIFSAAIA